MIDYKFRGRSTHSLDDKGRLIVPARFREVFKAKYNDDRFILTNLRQCLVAYPWDEWRIIEDTATSVADIDENVKAFLRFFISGAVEISSDRQGRVLIPPSLREYAGLEKEIILAGLGKTFEIWDKARWDEEMEKTRTNFGQISKDVAQIWPKSGLHIV